MQRSTFRGKNFTIFAGFFVVSREHRPEYVVIKLLTFLFPLPPVFTLATKMASREVKVIAKSTTRSETLTHPCAMATRQKDFLDFFVLELHLSDRWCNVSVMP